MALIDPNDADIKMKIYTKHGYKNKCWFNYKRLNGSDPDLIIEGMIHRFEAIENKALADVTQVLLFYNNRTNAFIKRYP